MMAGNEIAPLIEMRSHLLPLESSTIDTAVTSTLRTRLRATLPLFAIGIPLLGALSKGVKAISSDVTLMVFSIQNLPYWIFIGTGVLLFGLVIVSGGSDDDQTK